MFYLLVRVSVGSLGSLLKGRRAIQTLGLQREEVDLCQNKYSSIHLLVVEIVPFICGAVHRFCVLGTLNHAKAKLCSDSRCRRVLSPYARSVLKYA